MPDLKYGKYIVRNLPPAAGTCGQYEIVLSASKTTPRDELLRIASSVRI